MSKVRSDVVNTLHKQRAEMILVLERAAEDLELILNDPPVQRKTPNLVLGVATFCLIDLCLWHTELNDSGRTIPDLDSMMRASENDYDAMMKKMTGVNKEEWDKLSGGKQCRIMKEYMLLGLMDLKRVFDDIMDKGYATTLETEMILPAVVYTLGQITVFEEEREGTN